MRQSNGVQYPQNNRKRHKDAGDISIHCAVGLLRSIDGDKKLKHCLQQVLSQSMDVYPTNTYWLRSFFPSYVLRCAADSRPLHASPVPCTQVHASVKHQFTSFQEVYPLKTLQPTIECVEGKKIIRSTCKQMQSRW